MEVGPRDWLSLVKNAGEGVSELQIEISSRFRYKDYDFEKIGLQIYKCEVDNVVANFNLKTEYWEWNDYASFISDDKVWRQIEYIQFPIEEGNYVIQIIGEKCDNEYSLIKLHIENLDYHIHDITEYEINNLAWDGCLLKYNKYTLRRMLLDGVCDIDAIGTPGQIHCFGKKSIGLLPGESDREDNFSWCSGAYLSGHSFLLCFSHESFIFSNQGQKLIGVTLKNLQKFMYSKRKDLEIGFLGFNDYDSDKFVDNVSISSGMCYHKYSSEMKIYFENIVELVFNQNIDIIVINGNNEEYKSEDELILSTEILKECVYSDKIVIIGKCPWGWEYITGIDGVKDKSLCNSLMKEFGLILTNEYFVNKWDYIYLHNENTIFSNSYHYWNKLLHEINKFGPNNISINKNEMLLLVKDVELFFSNQKLSFEMERIILFIIELLNNETYLEIMPPFNTNKGVTLLILAIAKYRIKEFKSNELMIKGKSFYSFDSFDNWISDHLFWNNDSFMGFNFSSSAKHDLDNCLLLERLRCPIYEIYNEWQNTGIYLKYKDRVELCFAPLIDICGVEFKAKILIGCHTDELCYRKFKILNRIPIICKEYNWDVKKSTCINIDSPCDGIVYFMFIPDSSLSKVNDTSNNYNISFPNLKIGFLTISSINNDRKLVLSPIYSTYYEEEEIFDDRVIINDEIKWNMVTNTLKKLKKDYFPFWIELQGKKIILTLPTCSVVHKNEFFIRKLLNFWDRVVSTQDELFCNRKWLKERIVCDIQISAGYMHSGKFNQFVFYFSNKFFSGYPIMTHLDIIEKDFKAGLLDLSKLEEEGNWGLYHEIGHNRQSLDWTFNGTEEVTVNFFTLYTYFTLHHNVNPFEIDYIKDNINQTIEYLNEIKQYKAFPEKVMNCFDSKWRQNHRIAFMNYLILIIVFKWDTFKKVFQIYEKISSLKFEKVKNQSYQYKMMVWILIFSSTVGLDLKDFFNQWGWCFCMERANSSINIIKLCVEMQNILYKLNNGLCVKREVLEEDIISGYDDICKVNGWEHWKFDSLKFISTLKCRKGW
ncbi:hypothetical protein FG379_000736 [Cryptosporidium bovis]|uniref:uncharacterized protein n=1 Tax=Cryptosporidium bovis TaxID=310047 RepID=UPI00351A3A5A|nr:hypothetical protein FG379_000736 [Cryptosporidium bovis]